MKQPKANMGPASAPFIKRMATIIFEAKVPRKGTAVDASTPADFCLSTGDQMVYTSLLKGLFRVGEPIVSKSKQDIEGIMPIAVFMEALPRLAKANVISVKFWEHAASAPKHWRKVDSF